MRNSESAKTTLTVSLCLLLATFEGVDLQAAGLAVPQIKSEFGLLAGQLGTFTAASSVGVLFGAIGGGLAADRIGRRATLIFAIALFGLFSIGTALSGNFLFLVLTRLLTGVGLGAALPNLVALASENSPRHWKSRAIAIMYAGFPLGGALASAIMSLVATPGSALNTHLAHWGLSAGDWRTIFYIGGFAPLIAVPVLRYFLPDSREFALLDRSAAQGWWRVVLGGGRAWTSILLWISFTSTLMVLYLLLNWLPALLNSRGFSRADVFLVQLVFNGGGIPGSILVGIFMDGPRHNITAPLIYAGLVTLLILMAVMPTLLWMALVSGAALGGFVLGSQSLLYGIAPGCYPTAIRGTGVGAAVFAGRIGSVVGPLLAAGLVGAGRSAGEILMAIVPFAIVGGVAAVALTTRVGKQESADNALSTPGPSDWKTR